MKCSSVIFLVNPDADVGDIARVKQNQVVRVYEQIKHDFPGIKVEINKDKLNSREQRREMYKRFALEYDLLCSCGGDGTNAETANGLEDLVREGKIQRKEKAIAIAPMGYGNDYSSQSGIRTIYDFSQALNRYLINPFDNRSYFDSDLIKTELTLTDGSKLTFVALNAVGIGLDAATLIEFNKMRSKDQNATYNAAFYKAYKQMPKREIRVRIGDNERTMNALGVIVSNTPCFGKDLRINPHASPINREMDITYVRTAHWTIVGLAFEMLKRDKNFFWILKREIAHSPVEVFVDEPWQCESDGDIPYDLEKYKGIKKATFSIIPGAQRIVKPYA